MKFHDLVAKSKNLADENSIIILTATGATGVVVTSYLTGRASFKAALIIEKEELNYVRETDGIGSLSFKDKAALVWPLYIPAVGVGSITITSTILANRLSSKKAAALAAAYGISERAFSEYKEKVIEKLGETKELAIREDIAQDRVTKDPVSAKEVIIAGSGEVLCYDAITGRYFQSTVEEIKKAQNKINYDIINHMYASLSAFYDEIGLPPTSYSDEVGWNANALLDVEFATTMSSDDRPCIVIDFAVAPMPNYTQLY